MFSAAERAKCAARFPVTVGRVVKLDTWHFAETLVASDWDRAPFRITTNHRTGGAYLPTPSGFVELAVAVEVTGAMVRFHNGECSVRVRVTFIHDDEPPTSVGGWMFVQP